MREVVLVQVVRIICQYNNYAKKTLKSDKTVPRMNVQAVSAH